MCTVNGAVDCDNYAHLIILYRRVCRNSHIDKPFILGLWI